MEVIGAAAPSAATPVAHVAPRSLALSAPVLPSPGSCNSGPTCCPPSGSGVDYYGNLLYGYDSQLGEDLYLDAYLPEGASGPVPGVVVVHGGDFVSGTKCSNGPEATYMAQQGLAVFAIDYPLASGSQHPFRQAPADTALAVQWVRANAAKLQTNPAELALWGTSAGAPIAFDASYEAARSNPSGAVQAVVGWSGAYDWVTDYYADASAHPSDFQGAVDYLGCSDFTDSGCFGKLLSASPITHVERADPPSLLVTSTDAGTKPGQCEVVNPQNTVEMATALQAHGVPVTVQTTSACAHSIGYANDPIDPPGTGTMIENTTSWLLQTLASPPSPTVPSPLPPPITGPSVATKTSTCPPPSGSKVNYTANLVYGRDFNNPVYLDAYLPQAVSGGVPAVVIVHGGGHVSGDKCDVSSEAIALAQNGIAAFAVNYPLATVAQPTFPNPVYDVMNAVAWVRAHATTYGVAPNEIGLWGGSAGGNLALSAALAAPLVQPSAAVDTVVSWSGTADTFELIGEYQQTSSGISSGFDLANTSWAKYLGCSDPWSQTWDPTANTCLIRYEQASPAQLIDAAPPGSTAAPAILVASSTDFTGNGTCEIVPPRQQEEVDNRAQADGLTVQMDLNSLCAHAFAYGSTEFPATLAFLQAHLVSVGAVEHSVMANIANDGWNPKANGGRGGLWVDWRYGTVPLQTNGGTGSNAHDPLTDLRYLHNLWSYLGQGGNSATTRSEIARYTAVVKGEFNDGANAATNGVGWVYHEWVDLYELSGDPWYLAAARNVAEQYYERYYQPAWGAFFTVSPSCPTGCYNVDDALGMAAALVDAGRRFHDPAWEAAGASGLRFVQAHAWLPAYHVYLHLMTNVLVGSPPSLNPDENIWVSHAHTRTDDGHVVTAAAIGMDAQALLRAWRAAGNRAWLEDAETLLGAVNPASNLLGLWDRKDGGYFYGVVFKGATYDTAHDPTVRDRTKEAGRQQQVLLAARLADLATGGAYSSLVSELAQVATERAYYAAGHGFLYQEQSDWQPVVRKGEVKNFVTTEAMGIAIEALFALGTPSPW